MNPPVRQIKSASLPHIKLIYFILQIVFVMIIFIIWFTSESLRESKDLWILLLCAFPSNFITGIVPYDPAIIYFGQFYTPLYVIIVGTASIIFVEGINYSVLRHISNTKFMVKIRHRHFVSKIIALFDKAPFMALLFAGFLPVPFYPFRVLVILSGYPLIKYLLSVLISKTPRIYLLILLGNFIHIPDYMIFTLFIAIIIISYISILINYLKNRRSKE